MICIFLDERIEKTFQGERFIIVSFSVLQDNWISFHKQTAEIVTVGINRRLAKIHQLIEKVAGLSVLTYSDIPLQFLPNGEIDGTNDVPRMSRRDHIWANAVVLNLAYTFGLLCKRATSFLGQVEIYHDPKSLTESLRIAFESFIRNRITSYPCERGFQNIVISKIHEVPKSPNMKSANRLQLGISVVDHLGHQSQKLISAPSLRNRIEVLNQSSDILESLQKFIPSQPEISGKYTGEGCKI